MHYVDTCALADPLLARLPAKEDPNWRVGHFIRQIPTNYEASLRLDKNMLDDQKTAQYWDSIRKVTRDPLFQQDRLAEIARINFGMIEKPDFDMYRKSTVARATFIPSVNAEDVKTIAAEGTPWDAPGNIVFYTALDIIFKETTDLKSIDLSLDHNDTYEISVIRDNESVLVATIKPRDVGGLAHHKIELRTAEPNVKAIRIKAQSGDDMYSLGHLRVNNE